MMNKGSIVDIIRCADAKYISFIGINLLNGKQRLCQNLLANNIQVGKATKRITIKMYSFLWGEGIQVEHRLLQKHQWLLEHFELLIGLHKQLETYRYVPNGLGFQGVALAQQW